MTQEQMERFLAGVGREVQGRPGVLQFHFDDVLMFCVSDPKNDRMRIIAPIVPVEGAGADLLGRLLTANFYSALDARYATDGDSIYAAFLHPLGSLDETLLHSALRQVANLKKTFGDSFSSGHLHFGGGAGDAPPDDTEPTY